MAKIRIKIRNVVTGNEWTEDYDKVGIGDNGNIYQANDWANKLIESFNDTCRPGESHRELLSTEIIGVSMTHDWVKLTSGMSTSFRGNVVDLFRCKLCGITGKRYGLRTGVKRDSKYRAKKYEACRPENTLT